MYELHALFITDPLIFWTIMHTGKKFRFPYWEILVIFPKFGKKLWKKWENISQIWENSGTL